MLRPFTRVATLLLVPAVLRAQLAAPDQTEKPVIRAYDLTDLFRVPHNYPLPSSMIPATHLPDNNPGGGGGGQSLFGGGGMAPPEMGGPIQPTVTPESIQTLIMNTVAPESWRT